MLADSRRLGVRTLECYALQILAFLQGRPSECNSETRARSATP